MIVKLLLQLQMALIRRTESISGLQAIMEINASAQEIYAWMNTERYKRPLVQDAFPDLTKEEREFLITGLALLKRKMKICKIIGSNSGPIIFLIFNSSCST